MSNKKPAVICIDAEPDLHEIPREERLPWSGFEKVFEYLNAMRFEIERVTGVRPHYLWCWRLDPQMQMVYGDAGWALKHYDAQIRALEKEGDAFAVHPHFWDWDAARNKWFVNNRDMKWMEYCTRLALTTYDEYFQTPCTILRFGERVINNACVRLIEECGILYDLTLEPGEPSGTKTAQRKKFLEDLPDFTAAPRYPYRPDISNYLRPDSTRTQGLWMIPLSAGFFYYHYGRMETFLRKLFQPGSFVRRSSALNFYLHPRAFREILAQTLNAPEVRHLALVMRSCIGSNPAEFLNMEENFKTLLSHPEAGRLTFVTPPEAIRMLQEK